MPRPLSAARWSDTTAAGDGFNAGFLAAWLADGDVARAVRAGQGVAARVLQGHGALVPGPAQSRKETPDV